MHIIKTPLSSAFEPENLVGFTWFPLLKMPVVTALWLKKLFCFIFTGFLTVSRKIRGKNHPGAHL
jgi:hypothetical protein